MMQNRQSRIETVPMHRDGSKFRYEQQVIHYFKNYNSHMRPVA